MKGIADLTVHAFSYCDLQPNLIQNSQIALDVTNEKEIVLQCAVWGDFLSSFPKSAHVVFDHAGGDSYGGDSMG